MGPGWEREAIVGRIETLLRRVRAADDLPDDLPKDERETDLAEGRYSTYSFAPTTNH